MISCSSIWFGLGSRADLLEAFVEAWDCPVLGRDCWLSHRQGSELALAPLRSRPANPGGKASSDGAADEHGLAASLLCFPHRAYSRSLRSDQE